MRLLAVHEIPRDLDEVGHVARDETAFLASRDAELLEIEVPSVPSARIFVERRARQERDPPATQNAWMR